MSNPQAVGSSELHWYNDLPVIFSFSALVVYLLLEFELVDFLVCFFSVPSTPEGSLCISIVLNCGVESTNIIPSLLFILSRVSVWFWFLLGLLYILSVLFAFIYLFKSDPSKPYLALANP